MKLGKIGEAVKRGDRTCLIQQYLTNGDAAVTVYSRNGYDYADVIEVEDQTGWGCQVPLATKESKPATCECGAEKAKSAGHSSWCPKYEKPR